MTTNPATTTSDLYTSSKEELAGNRNLWRLFEIALVDDWIFVGFVMSCPDGWGGDVF